MVFYGLNVLGLGRVSPKRTIGISIVVFYGLNVPAVSQLTAVMHSKAGWSPEAPVWKALEISGVDFCTESEVTCHFVTHIQAG